jgi:hypothetical protein
MRNRKLILVLALLFGVFLSLVPAIEASVVYACVGGIKHFFIINDTTGELTGHIWGTSC